MHLSVNLNKVALLRNSRGGTNPSVSVAAERVLRAGAHGLTLHWREDNRHTRADDVRQLRALARSSGVEFNLEGDTRAELMDLALEILPDQLTLVPVTPGEITSDHGWDLPAQASLLEPHIARARGAGIRVSIFMDADRSMRRAAEVGADRVELYTEPYAKAFGTAKEDAATDLLAQAARAATEAGLGVNAGHDLDLRNLPRLARQVPQIREVSIGHALLADALVLGLEETVRRYLAACRGEDVPVPRTC